MQEIDLPGRIDAGSSALENVGNAGFSGMRGSRRAGPTQ